MPLKLSTKDLVLCGLFTAVICVSAIITIPLTVPITLQVAAVFTAAAVLGGRLSLMSIGAYILLGAFGLPVFSGMRGGMGHLFGATGGYIIGFIPAAFIIGTAAKKINDHHYQIKLILVMLLALTVLYSIGTVQFAFVTGRRFTEALWITVVPFVIFDLIKIVLSATVAYALRKNYVAAV